MPKAKAESYRELAALLRYIATDVRGARERLIVNVAAKELERLAKVGRLDNVIPVMPRAL